MRKEPETVTGAPVHRPQLDLALAGLQGRHELRRLRASVGSLAVLLVVAALWIVPWVPYGMTVEDFDLATSLALVLTASVGVGAGMILLHWAPLFTEEPRSELIRALFGAPLSVRSRVRFLKRLRFQCDEGLRGRSRPFALAVIQLPPIQRGTPEGERVTDLVLSEIRQVIRTMDVLGDSEAQEVWVLLAGASAEGAAAACARMVGAVKHALEARGDAGAGNLLRTGWGAFELDGRDPNVLLRTARRRSARGELAREDEAA